MKRRTFLRLLATAPIALPAVSASISGADHFTAFGRDPSDLLFLKTRRFQIEEISRVFRVPIEHLYKRGGQVISPPSRTKALT